MKLLALLLSLCWPSTALSAPTFTTRSIGSNPPATQLHLRIPRGGQAEEEFMDLDNPTEESVPVQAPEVKGPEAPVATSTNKLAAVGALSPLLAALQSAGSCYSASLVARPILTKSLTAGITFFLSDYTAQSIEKPKDDDSKAASAPVWKHDWMRTFVSCAVGLFYFGPAAHAWYEWVFGILPGTSLVSTLQKAALGQVIFGPTFTCIFFATSLMQSGQFNLGNWVQKIKRDLPGAWISGLGFWPLVDFISFSVIPVKFIPLFINLCSFVWTIYLSTVANRPSGKKE